MELQWSRSLVKLPEWGHLVRHMEQMAHQNASIAHRPIEPRAEFIVDDSGQRFPIAVDGMTQAFQKQYKLACRDTLLMLRGYPEALAVGYNKRVKELHQLIMIEEKANELDRQEAEVN